MPKNSNLRWHTNGSNIIRRTSNLLYLHNVLKTEKIFCASQWRQVVYTICIGSHHVVALRCKTLKEITDVNELLSEVLQAFEALRCQLGDLVSIQVKLRERAGQTCQPTRGLPSKPKWWLPSRKSWNHFELYQRGQIHVKHSLSGSSWVVLFSISHAECIVSL